MEDTEKKLKEELSEYFVLHAQKMTVLIKLIIGLLKLGTVTYTKLAKVLNPNVKKDSNLRRIQRFMAGFRFCKRAYVQLVWHFFVKKDRWVILSVDRTNWKFGKSDINILMLGISYNGTAIPLVWKLLDKRGNSNTKERIELIEELKSCLTSSQNKKIKCLLADREFIGKDWISYLKKQIFTFVIRIKSNTQIRKMGKFKGKRASLIFKEKRFKSLRKKRILWGHELFVAGQQITDKEWLILISDQSLSTGRQFYGERWGIEVFFGACKKRGFNFESTHVTKLDRIFNLVFLIAMAFIWAVKTGEWLVEKGYQIPIKKLKNRKVKLYSIFRIGFDYLQERLLNFLTICTEIRLLSCT